MARGRQTELAVLGALSVQPMTGYAVREEIRQLLGHFWSESYGQIYPALAELATDPHTEHHPYWLITISAGEHTARAAIAWADESLTALSQQNDAQARTQTPHDGP